MHTLPADDLAKMKTLLDPVADEVTKDQPAVHDMLQMVRARPPQALDCGAGDRRAERHRARIDHGVARTALHAPALRVAAGAMLVASVAINFVNIIGRYVFSVSITWAEEAMLFLMIGCVFLAAGPVGYLGRHIRMDVVVSRCRRARASSSRFSPIWSRSRPASCWRSSPGRS